MLYICDAPDGMTWFRLETEVEADQESELMGHAVAKHFRRDKEAAIKSFKPASSVSFEEHIGRDAYLTRVMPRYLTLRDREGEALATAKVPPEEGGANSFKSMVVGTKNSDPYADYSDAIKVLADHLGLSLKREDCYPYG